MGEPEEDGMKYWERTREIERPRTGPGAKIKARLGFDTDTREETGPDIGNEQ